MPCHHVMLQDDEAIGQHFPHPVHGEATLLLRLQDCVNYLSINMKTSTSNPFLCAADIF